MLNIIISGAPGCGKGTQSALIIEKYHLQHFSTGDLLRKEFDQQTPLGIEANSHIRKGNLVPDHMIIAILTQAIQNLDAQCQGIIFDGFPRTLAQAEALESLMDSINKPVSMFIELNVPDRQLINRLLLRGETSGRCDDNLETILKRLEVYYAKTAPVTDFYKSIGKLQQIDGSGSVEDIFARISAVLDLKKR